jgi:predicted RNase H-like nuclease (RuvC/YqgF family)
MLAKKYSDAGGLLTEEDAKELTANYVKYGEISSEFQKLSAKVNPGEKSEGRIKELSGKLSALRKEIVDLETSYSSLFNHTADTRAQNRAIQWYILHITHVQKSDQNEVSPLFEGETFDDRLDRYYELEENGDELYDIVGGKVATFVSFWYYSSGAVSTEDFERLDADLEEGNV